MCCHFAKFINSKSFLLESSGTVIYRTISSSDRRFQLHLFLFICFLLTSPVLLLKVIYQTVYWGGIEKVSMFDSFLTLQQMFPVFFFIYCAVCCMFPYIVLLCSCMFFLFWFLKVFILKGSWTLSKVSFAATEMNIWFLPLNVFICSTFTDLCVCEYFILFYWPSLEWN